MYGSVTALKAGLSTAVCHVEALARGVHACSQVVIALSAASVRLSIRAAAANARPKGQYATVHYC